VFISVDNRHAWLLTDHHAHIVLKFGCDRPNEGIRAGAQKILHKIAKIRVSGNSGLLQPNDLSAAAYGCALLLLVSTALLTFALDQLAVTLATENQNATHLSSDWTCNKLHNTSRWETSAPFSESFRPILKMAAVSNVRLCLVALVRSLPLQAPGERKKMCAPVLKCNQLQGSSPPDPSPGALPICGANNVTAELNNKHEVHLNAYLHIWQCHNIKVQRFVHLTLSRAHAQKQPSSTFRFGI